MSQNAAGNLDRSKTRRRTLKAGVIAYGGGYVTLKCGVRDMSESGARLLTEGSVDAPDTFVLKIETDGLDADCEVVWRRGREIGVRFLASRRLEKRRVQIVDQWVKSGLKPSLRRQPKSAV
jgi:hypothetical protein